MPDSLFSLQDTRRTWLVYAGALGALALLFFADLAGHPQEAETEALRAISLDPGNAADMFFVVAQANKSSPY